MSEEVKVPSLGESESEATLAAWHAKEGDAVREDDVLAEVESDKITMEITALASGVLKGVRKGEGDTVAPGEVIAVIEEGAAGAEPAPKAARKKKAKREKPKEEEPAAGEAPEEPAPERGEPEPEAAAAERSVPKRVEPAEPSAIPEEGRVEERVPLSGLRRRIAERLTEAQQTAAILTTFNEIDMKPVMELRTKYRDAFREKHGVDLGLTSFFVRACVEGLRRHPVLNACIDGEEIVYRNYFDIGIAVSTERGLVVPVLRDAGLMGMADIERRVADFAARAREGGLMPGELKGGTFSITNGGVFGSLLSTPILNPPQSGILGMHAIKKRPVVENDEIVVRPMMYVALSYDHRLVDGRDAVRFLVAVKESLEYPGRMLLDL